jgi:ABC-type Zn2+ transport system substrate-binding protein/surface adhesin
VLFPAPLGPNTPVTLPGAKFREMLRRASTRDRLIELSPEDQAEFTANAEELITELQQVDRWITEQIATIPLAKRRLVTTHDA